MLSEQFQAMKRVHAVAGALAPQQRRQQDVETKACASFLGGVPLAPPNAIFHTAALFNADTDKRKVNLGIGAYRDNEGKPYVLKVVRKAEKLILNDTSLNHEYLGISGHPGFISAARALLFGKDSPAVKAQRIATIQSLSGTGALTVGADFIAKFFPKVPVYLPSPTWPNHDQIFGRGSPVKTYRYWDAKGRKLNIDGMLEDIRNAPERSFIVLHACAHNPTGVDPTVAQWKQIAAVCKQRNHIPFFDSAYQGFATGSLENDAFAVRYFVEQGFEILAAQSFAKNFGLYDCRVGTLSVVCEDDKKAAAVASQLELVIRANYSNPPSHGARIVHLVLSDPEMAAEWREELKIMSGRIQAMRKVLYDELVRLGTPGDWTHVTSQIGMFSYTGLGQAQCKHLREKMHIYLLMDGRISMAGINTGNYKYLAQCIDYVVRNIKD